MLQLLVEVFGLLRNNYFLDFVALHVDVGFLLDLLLTLLHSRLHLFFLESTQQFAEFTLALNNSELCSWMHGHAAKAVTLIQRLLQAESLLAVLLVLD